MHATGRLLVAFLAFLAATCFVALFPPLITYKWTVAKMEIDNISRRVANASMFVDESDVTAENINAWFAGDLPPTHPLAKELGTSSRKDPWGHPYRCIRFAHTYRGERRAFGIFSMGRDGVSATDGNDSDDLNSWNPESHQWYVRDIRNRTRWECLMKGLLLAPFVYFGVIGIAWILAFPWKRHRTSPQ